MRPIIKKVATLFLVLALVTGGMAAFAGTAAADTTTLAGDGTDTVTGFNASSSDYIERSINADDGTNGFDGDGTETLFMNVSYDGHDYAEISAAVDDGTATSQTVNMSHDKLKKLPGDAGKVTTVNVTTWGENASGDTTTAATEFSVDITFADDHAVRTIHSSNNSIVENIELSDDDDDGWVASLSSLNPLSSSDELVTIEDDVGIAGSQTDIKVYSEDSDVTEVIDNQLEDSEDGDRVGMFMTSEVGDGIVYVFANEPGETITGDEVDEDKDTYIVAHEGGQMDVNLGSDDFDDTDETASLSLTAGEKFDRKALQDDLGYSWRQAYGLSFDTFSLSDLWPF
ncbi:hypothetical protein [Halosolutus gelatinilyticus]|uniref:hypothetical protein n=1 Tax=Halosolutus gelatinilyticus TaxID=2931975 RepID=UPI001FF1399E|nr:hypothetical protein [Halosolutus gelatinilyticus]